MNFRRQLLLSVSYTALCLGVGMAGMHLLSGDRQSAPGLVLALMWLLMWAAGNPILVYWDCRRKGGRFGPYVLATTFFPGYGVALYLARTYGAWSGLLIPAYFLLFILLAGLPMSFAPLYR